MEFEHYIITRYNLHFRNWRKDKNGKQVRGETWLQNRKMLFETYCAPSVQKQVNQNFKWLILTDAFGPKLEFDPGIIQLRLDSAGWLGGLQRWLKKHCKADYIITTRLDNDDMLHEMAIADLQQCFSSQDNEYLNLYAGWLQHGDKIYRSQHPRNQFLSRVEATPELKTVYETEHGSPAGAVRQLTSRRYWVRIIHTRNMYKDNLASSEYCGKIKLKGFGQ